MRPRRREAIALFAMALVPGCGGQPETSRTASDATANPASFQSRSAAEYLSAIFSRYRNAASYHDEAVVRMSYRSGGKSFRESAPMSVWLDQNQLSVAAYDARIWSDSEVLTAWIEDADTEFHDSQVWQRGVSKGRPPLETLLSDPLLARRVSGGAAGPPPQLEWLLAAEPMSRLFAGDSVIEFGPSDELNGHRCESIVVNAGGDHFRFWVDAQQGLIRSVELPPVDGRAVAAAAAAGESSTRDRKSAGQSIPDGAITLKLDLVAASFATPDEGPRYHRLPARPKYVSRFVSLPPDPPPAHLGTRVSPFVAVSRDRAFRISERGSDRPVTVLLGYSADARSQASLDTLHQWASRIAGELAGKVRVTVVAADSSGARLPDGTGWGVIDDPGQQLLNRYEMTGGTLVVTDDSGVIAWTQEGFFPADQATVGAIVADVLAGVDVPARYRKQWQEDVDSYQRRLAEVRIRGN